jgi:hypothetical protein
MEGTDMWKNKELLEFVGLTIAWPALAFLAVFHTLNVELTNHQEAAVGLAISGILAWVWRNH